MSETPALDELSAQWRGLPRAGIGWLRGQPDGVSRAAIPSRERYLLLNHRLARRIVKAHTDWLDEVERELG